MLPEHTGHARGLKQETLEFGKHGTIPVHPVVHLVPIGVSGQDAHVDEPPEFPLDAPVTGAHEPHDLSQVERPVGVSEEKR